jgi:hypothetical protein
MSAPQTHQSHDAAHEAPDPVESVVHSIPIVLPLVGGVLMFLLALIAVTMG